MSTFGTGFKLDRIFDVDDQNGTLPTISGSAVIERDIAFTLVRETKTKTKPGRGVIPDADFAAEIELSTRRVLTRDPRITAVQSIEVTLDVDGKPNTVAIDLVIDTADGDTEALLIEI